MWSLNAFFTQCVFSLLPLLMFSLEASCLSQVDIETPKTMMSWALCLKDFI